MNNSTNKPIKLYYWGTPNGWKISIMLEECGVAYDLHKIDISKGEQFSEDFLKISPNNKIPAILDPYGPDGKQISVFESGAILQYLGRKFGKFYPQEERKRIEIDEWLFWQVGGFGPMLGQNHHFNMYAPEKIPYAINRYLKETNRLYGVLNLRLENRDYICDEYSIADIACVGWAKLWERQGQNIEEFPNVKLWLERCLARPAVAKGIAVGEQERIVTNMKDSNVQSILSGQKSP